MSRKQQKMSRGAGVCMIVGISASIAIKQFFFDYDGLEGIAVATALGAAGAGLGLVVGNLLFPRAADKQDRTEDTFE